jgi:NTP pyrophosphatase (non-canonical NTP hydrolase)
LPGNSPYPVISDMTKSQKTIRQMTKEVVKSFDTYQAQGTKKWDWQSAVKDLPYQVGSVAKITMQLSGERWADKKTKKQLMAELGDELADIIGVTLFIAANLDIDIEDAWHKMLGSDVQKVTERSK